MIRPGFLDSDSRRDLIEPARDGSIAHRLARRANLLVLLDDGMSCMAVAKELFLDDDTIRTRYQLYQQDGIEGLAVHPIHAVRPVGCWRRNDALAEMIAVQIECATWFEALPESLRDSVTAVALQDVIPAHFND
jgi:hypothetical protein